MNLALDLARHLDPFAVANDVGLELDPWQGQLIESREPRILLNVTRQGGKSTTTATIAVDQALTDPGLILVTSPSLRQSVELFRKIQETLRVVRPTPEIAIETTTRLELSNGARIVSLPGTEETVRGFSAPKLILIDEASRVDDEFYMALRPMLATSNGRLIALTTPWGRRGWFFNAWEFGGNSWQRFRVPAVDCPRISKEYLEEELRELGPLRFASEYCCEFVDTADQFFPSALIQRALSKEVLPLWAA